MEVCQNWKVPAASAIENQPVKSDVPTLVISGEFDPITPPAFGTEAAQTLSKSFDFMIPRAGHGSSVSEDCPRSLLLAFLDDPAKKPDDACLAELAQTPFTAPLKAEDFKLTPVTESVNTGLSQNKISSVLPEGWKQISQGAYSPNGQITDHTAIVLQVVPVPPETVMNLLKSQLKASDLNVDFAERWRPRLERLNVKHEIKVSTKRTTILGDPRSLEQVFNNLIGNSVEAMKDTGGHLVVFIRAASPVAGRDRVEVNVIDNGPGIPEEIRARIFEPFFTTNRNGTGLGLAIARRIVNHHKGTIEVSSVPGGTVFQVLLPLIRE